MVFQKSQEKSGNFCKSQEKQEKKTFLLRLLRKFCGIQRNIPLKPYYNWVLGINKNVKVYGVL